MVWQMSASLGSPRKSGFFRRVLKFAKFVWEWPLLTPMTTMTILDFKFTVYGVRGATGAPVPSLVEKDL
jgi:hypothetical protein